MSRTKDSVSVMDFTDDSSGVSHGIGGIQSYKTQLPAVYYISSRDIAANSFQSETSSQYLESSETLRSDDSSVALADVNFLMEKMNHLDEIINEYEYLGRKCHLGVDFDYIAEQLLVFGEPVLRYYLELANETAMWSKAFRACKAQGRVSLFPNDIFVIAPDGRISVSNDLPIMGIVQRGGRNNLHNHREIKHLRQDSYRKQLDADSDQSKRLTNSFKIDHVRTAMVSYFTRANMWATQASERRSMLHNLLSGESESPETARIDVIPPPTTSMSTDIPVLISSDKPKKKEVLKRRGTFRQATHSSDAPTMHSVTNSDNRTALTIDFARKSSLAPSRANSYLMSRSISIHSMASCHFIEEDKFCSDSVFSKIKVLYTWLESETMALRIIEESMFKSTTHANTKHEAREGSLPTWNRAKAICPGLRPEMPIVQRFLANNGYITNQKQKKHRKDQKQPTNESQTDKNQSINEEGGWSLHDLAHRHRVGLIAKRKGDKNVTGTVFIQIKGTEGQQDVPDDEFVCSIIYHIYYLDRIF